MRRGLVITAVVLLSLVALAWSVWPTPWAYGMECRERPFEGEHHVKDPLPVRTHRVTGEKQLYGGSFLRCPPHSLSSARGCRCPRAVGLGVRIERRARGRGKAGGIRS
jgi:hypothetical protein